MPQGGKPVTLAVLSAKGGCGRSTVAINLAYLLAAAGRRVALVDLAQFGSLAVLLQAAPGPGSGLGPVAACLASAHRGELGEVLDAALLSCRLGACPVAVLTAAPPPRQDELAVAGVLEVLRCLSERGYDLVLDTSHELSDRLAGALHAASHHLWVLSPDPAAGWHTLQALDAARQLCAPQVPAGILVNRYHRRCGLSLPDLAAAVGLPVWGALPDLPGRLPLSAHRGVPLVAHRWGRWRRELIRTLRRLDLAYHAPRSMPRHRREASHVQV